MSSRLQLARTHVFGFGMERLLREIECGYKLICCASMAPLVLTMASLPTYQGMHQRPPVPNQWAGPLGKTHYFPNGTTHPLTTVNGSTCEDSHKTHPCQQQHWDTPLRVPPPPTPAFHPYLRACYPHRPRSMAKT